MSTRWVRDEDTPSQRDEDAPSQELTPQTRFPVDVKDARLADSPRGRRILTAQKQDGPNRLKAITSAQQRAEESRALSLNPADTPGLCCQLAKEIVDQILERTKVNLSRNSNSSRFSIRHPGRPPSPGRASSVDRFARSVPELGDGARSRTTESDQPANSPHRTAGAP